MKLFVATALLLAVLPGAFSADESVVTNLLMIPDHASLEIVAPKEWSFVSKGRQTAGLNVPRTAEMSSPKGDLKLLMTAFWDGFVLGKDGKKLTAAEYEKMVKDSLNVQYVPTSVEKKAVIEKFSGTNAQGWFSRFADASWAGKTPPAGEYAHVATGWFHTGELWGHFTLLTNEKDGPHVKQALSVVEQLKQAATKP